MKKSSFVFAATIAAMLAGTASGGTVGFSFSFVTSSAARTALGLNTSAANASGPSVTSDAATTNTPYILISSTGTDAATLTSFSFTLGASRVFDFAIRESGYGGLSWSQVLPPVPDSNGTDFQSTTLSYSFGGFDSGERFSAQVDIDPGALSLSDLMAAISGKSVTANFSNGQSLQATYATSPVETSASVYTVSVSAPAPVAVVPLPTAGWAGLALMATCGVMQYRRKLALRA